MTKREHAAFLAKLVPEAMARFALVAIPGVLLSWLLFGLLFQPLVAWGDELTHDARAAHSGAEAIWICIKEGWKPLTIAVFYLVGLPAAFFWLAQTYSVQTIAHRIAQKYGESFCEWLAEGLAAKLEAQRLSGSTAGPERYEKIDRATRGLMDSLLFVPRPIRAVVHLLLPGADVAAAVVAKSREQGSVDAPVIASALVGVAQRYIKEGMTPSPWPAGAVAIGSVCLAGLVVWWR